MKTLNVDPTRVTELAANGMIQREIAVILKCSTDTIQRHFAKEYEDGRELCNSKLRSKQVELALAGNTTLLIWLGKQRLGQSEKVEHSGSGGFVFGLSEQPKARETEVIQ